MNETLEKTSTETTHQPVNITDNAAKEINRLIREKNIPADHSLRLGVKGGGCSGLSYLLGFDTRKENDTEYDINGIKVLVESSHMMYLAGIQLDFHDGLNARGFAFNNPNATKTCGCGSSFSA